MTLVDVSATRLGRKLVVFLFTYLGSSLYVDSYHTQPVRINYLPDRSCRSFMLEYRLSSPQCVLSSKETAFVLLNVFDCTISDRDRGK